MLLPSWHLCLPVYFKRYMNDCQRKISLFYSFNALFRQICRNPAKGDAENLDLSRNLGVSKADENTEAEYVEDVFRACMRVASAPLHEASKTIKSGIMLRTEIVRGQLDFVSNNPPANFNA